MGGVIRESSDTWAQYRGEVKSILGSLVSSRHWILELDMSCKSAEQKDNLAKRIHLNDRCLTYIRVYLNI